MTIRKNTPTITVNACDLDAGSMILARSGAIHQIAAVWKRANDVRLTIDGKGSVTLPKAAPVTIFTN